MRKLVYIYVMPTTKELEKVYDHTGEIPIEIPYISMEKYNAFACIMEIDGVGIPIAPPIHMIFKQKVAIFDYDDYVKMMDDPDHKPTPLLPTEITS